MRKLVAVALAGALTLVVAAVAFAASETSGTTVQNYDQTYTQTRTNKSTGTEFSTSSNDPQNPRNEQPKRVTDFDITFPRGSKIDSKAAPQCKADQEDFAEQDNPDRACPRGSKIGSGVVTARLPFEFPDLNGTVRAYNANKAILLYVQVDAPGAAQTLLLKGKFRGRRLLTDVPHTCVPPNRADNGCRDANGQEQAAILTNFELKTTAKSRRDGRRKRQLITTPPTCNASNGWIFQADITYADDTKVTIREDSPCRR
jgi:hypothetical protein